MTRFSEFSIFLFGLVNFGILMGVLLWGLRKTAQQFFYARREGLKDEIATSASLLKEARMRHLKGARAIESLSHDIGELKLSFAQRTEDERVAILAEAERHAARLNENALRYLKAEEMRLAKLVRARAIARAFEMAEQYFKEGMTKEMGARVINLGLNDFTSLLGRVPSSTTTLGGYAGF